MRRSLALVALLSAIAPATAAPPGGAGYSFAGFSDDGSRYLKHGADDRVCTVALPATCQPIDRKAVKDAGFAKPGRTRKLGATTVEVTVEDGAVVLKAGDRVLGRHRPAAPAISANANVFVTADEGAVAVEYEGQDKAADVVVFPLRPAREAGSPGAGTPTPAPAPPGRGNSPGGPKAPNAPNAPNAYDRALAKGGVWEQRIVPCDQAGVRLVLKKSRSFDLRVDTKCQAQKDATELSGKWTTEGDDRLELTFENENGPTEALPCRLAVCPDAAGGEPGEDCLSCSDAEVSFTLRVVRR